MAELIKQQASEQQASEAQFTSSARGTPASPSMRTRGTSSRASSADGRRPGCNLRIAESGSRGSLRTTRVPRQSSGSLLRAASVTTRVNAIWDPQEQAAKGKSCVGDSQAANRRAPHAWEAEVAALAQKENKQPCPSSPSNGLAPRRIRSSTGSVGTLPSAPPPDTPRGKSRISPVPKSAFGRAAVGHTARSPRDVVAAGTPAAAGPPPKAESVAEDPDAQVRERDRVRVARQAAVVSRQQATEEVRMREEEQRRRAAAVRERARQDREAARIARESTVYRSAPLGQDSRAEAWIT